MTDQFGTSSSKRLFIACFVALVATSFAFVIRSFLITEWQIDFGLSETQKGEILGAGLWPFGLSIVLFSLVIDRIGYGKSMIFAFVFHLSSTILLVGARSYAWLYWGSILNGLAAGTVEAVINPAVASAYPKQKTKMLTILHAGWPGGLALGGMMTLLLGEQGLELAWRYRVAVILVPVIAYGIMLLKTKFPVSERVVAGVPYKKMLAEAGALGCLVVVYMVLVEVNRLLGLDMLLDTTFFDLPSWPITALMGVITVAYLVYTKSLGRWMYVFLLFVMILLAITELGTDTWIKELMGPAMKQFGLSGGWVLVYTATIMTILRFLIGPIQKGLGSVLKVLGTPLGILLLSSLFAAAGLYFLAGSRAAVWILITATIYGIGQCFFWPVTLGLVSERFPKGGALTLNAIAGVGMLGVGILGSQLLGFWQDTSIDSNLMAKDKAAYERLMGAKEKKSIFGSYKALNWDVVNAINDKTALYDFRAKKAADITPAPSDNDLTKTLADDLKYQTLVRVAYDHLVQDPQNKDAKSHGDMHRALEDNGLLVTEEECNRLVADKNLLGDTTTAAKREAMSSVATLPIIMALCYLGLMFYFRVKGGYKAVDIADQGPERDKSAA